MLARVKKNDTVVVISGKDKGKRGSVIDIMPGEGLVVVKGVAIVTRHVKAKRQGDVAGIKKEEGCLDLCKVMPVCSACDKPCRITVKMLDNGTKARSCNQCKEVF